jgi:class 3 adenylate cyclase
VNVAARVEAVTRQTGDSILMTEATRAALGGAFASEARGEFELKGLERPVELFVPVPAHVIGSPHGI